MKSFPGDLQGGIFFLVYSVLHGVLLNNGMITRIIKHKITTWNSRGRLLYTCQWIRILLVICTIDVKCNANNASKI